MDVFFVTRAVNFFWVVSDGSSSMFVLIVVLHEMLLVLQHVYEPVRTVQYGILRKYSSYGRRS
jgi:hypothetical protein